MDLFLSKYKKYFAIALILLVTVPCSVKKEITCLYQSETSQQSNSGKSKVSCSNYYELKRADRKGKIQQQTLTFHFASQGNDFFAFAEKIILPDLFSYLKEKIPSYLLFRRFLI